MWGSKNVMCEVVLYPVPSSCQIIKIVDVHFFPIGEDFAVVHPLHADRMVTGWRQI
jgi:hypothetical protein